MIGAEASAGGLPRRGSLGLDARLAAYGLAVLFGLAHFLLVVHPSMLLASSPLWRNPPGDQAQMLTGIIALLRDHWRFPLADTTLLSFDRPFSIVFTDSVPWLVLLVKALGFGPEDVSVLGITVLLAFVLQPVAMLAFLRALGIRRAEVLAAGVALGAMLPAWYLREGQSGHRALGSHWLLVFALAVAAHAIRRGVSARVMAAAAALGALALGIHAYLFVMASAVLVPALLGDLCRGLPGGGMRAALGIASYAVVQALASWVLDYWGFKASGGGFGLYSMNLLSVMAPQLSGLRALVTGDAGAIIDAAGGAQWEGFNYLGAGMLLVLFAAVLVLARGEGRPGRAVLRAAAPLALALVALTCAALSNRVYLGHTLLLDLPLPSPLATLFGVVRSSGRLFWIVAYAMLGAALAVLARSQARRGLAAILVAAVLLQCVDTDPLRAGVRRSTAPVISPTIVPTSAWSVPPLAGASVRFLPPFECARGIDLDVIRQLALVIIRAGGRVDGVAAARAPEGTCERAAQAEATLPGGPDVVNLLLTHSVPEADLRRAAQSGQCVAFEAGLACGARVRALP